MTSAAEWTGPVGDAWASEWQRTDRSFADLARHLNAAILDRSTASVARIVDIGCGAGATSLAIAAARPDTRVTGIDISSELIAIAAQRGAALPNLSFASGAVELEAKRLSPIDLYISRHGVMFFPGPKAAFDALHRAASPGAGLIFSCFRAAADNPWASEVVAAVLGAPPLAQTSYTPGPFAFADADFVAAMLTSAGWEAPERVAVDFTYRAGEGADPVADALSFFQRIGPSAPALRDAAAADRPAMLDRLAVVLERYRSGNVVDFPAAAWLWSARASSMGHAA